MRRTLDVKTALAVVVTVLLWASAFPGIRLGLRAFSPGHLVLLRFLAASVAMLLFAGVTRVRLPERRDLPALVGCGFVGISLYHGLLAYGQVTVSSSAASFLVNASPVFTALLATWLHGERLEMRGWLGVLTSFLGVTLIALGGPTGIHFTPGAALVLLAAAAMSVYFLSQKRLVARYGPLAFSVYVIVAGTLLLVPFFAWGLPQAVVRAPQGITWTVVYLGVLPAALAYGTWTYVLSRIPPARAASLLYLVPPTVILMAWIWLREPPAPLALVGGPLALAGVAITSTSRNRKTAGDAPRTKCDVTKPLSATGDA